MNLKQELIDECLKFNMLYSANLERIRISVKDIWKTPRLPQFPDHGIIHSENIIDILGHLLSHLQNTPNKLTLEELYILLASCYLHDIGMQDFIIPGKSIAQFGIEEFEIIRKRHPQRSYDLILQRSRSKTRDQFGIDLQDDSFLSAIAWVSKGHGSDYFDETIAEFRKNIQRPGGKFIRGELLTSLLLIADELDLHKDRATFPKEMDFQPLALLHHYIHHYTNGVEVVNGKTNKERKIILTLCYPENSEQYAPLVRDWIVRKLQKQFRKTREIIKTSTDGELILSTRIELNLFIDDKDKIQRPMPIIIQKLLDRELIQKKTINYKEKLVILQDFLISSNGLQIINLVSEYEEAIVHILKWIEINCSYLTMNIIQIDFQNEPFSYESFFVYLINELLLWFRNCNLDSDAALGINRTDYQHLPLIDQLSILLLDINKFVSDQRIVLLIQNFDIANQIMKDKIFKQLIPCFMDNKINLKIILTSNRLLSDLNQVNKISSILVLGKIAASEIAMHLKECGYNPIESSEAAADIYGTSLDGLPKGVIYKINLMDLQEYIIVNDKG